MTAYYTLRRPQMGFIHPFIFRDEERDDGFNACTSYTTVDFADLATTVSGASAGTGILVNNATHTGSITLNGNGSAGAPIVIRPVNPGQGIFTGDGRIIMDGSYTTLSGFDFAGGARGTTSIVEWNDNSTDNLRLTNCKIHGFTQATYVQWINLRGTNQRIDHCEIYDKDDLGEMLRFRSGGSNGTNCRVDHNYFHDFADAGGNGSEAIRFATSAADLFSVTVEENLFQQCSGENEVFSVKAQNVSILRNTFRNCWDSVVFREGSNNTFSDNFVIVTADEPQGKPSGIRVHDSNHTVTNNHFSGCRRGIMLCAGGIVPVCYEICHDTVCTGNRFTNSDLGDVFDNFGIDTFFGGCAEISDQDTFNMTISDNSGAANIDNARTSTDSDIGVRW